MTDPALIRAAALFGPALVVVAVGLSCRPPSQERDRWTAALLLATAWCAVTLYPLNLLALQVGWWQFHTTGAALHGIPVDLWLGWSLLWGTLPALLVPRVPVPLVLAGLAWVDLALMPQGEPVVVLGSGWLYGQALGLVVCLLPATLLATWTRRRKGLAWRVWVQLLLAASIMFGLPLGLLGWQPAWPTPVVVAGLQLGALAVLPGLAAVREFNHTGRGTPLPYDPPLRLVTSGPYAYVRNPMQLAVALGFLIWAVLALDWRPLAGVAVVVGYGVGVASWHEGHQLERNFGNRWRSYRDQVRPWLPRLRPVPQERPAVLYVAESCVMCRGVAAWFEARSSVSLRIAAAEAHPAGLRRMRYESPAGQAFSGMAALARALEHLHLGWALLGWALALPGVAMVVQLCADVFGAGPRTVAAPPHPRDATEPG